MDIMIIKTPHVCFPTGLTGYDYEPYTMQNVLQYNGKFYVCGTGRQTLVRSKTSNDNYYLLTMTAIAQEIRYRRGERKTDVVLAAGLPLASFGREKKDFREYLFRKEQPLRFRYEDESYEIRIQDVKLFPQGYSALALHPECVRDEPSVLLADIGGWTVDLMRLGNSVLNGQSCSMDPAAKEIIVRQGRLYTEKILSAIMEAGFDLKAIPSVIMGGGASILKRHVTPQDGLCRQIYLTDVHANASGYERIVRQMCAK